MADIGVSREFLPPPSPQPQPFRSPSPVLFQEIQTPPRGAEMGMEVKTLTISQYKGFEEELEEICIWNFPETMFKTLMTIGCFPPPAHFKYKCCAMPKLLEDFPMGLGTNLSPQIPNHVRMERGGSSTNIWSNTMKILIWNCRGAGSEAFRRAAMDLINTNTPTILALIETKLDREGHFNLLNFLPFDGMEQVPAQGFSGGMAVFWRKELVNMTFVILTSEEIHASVEVLAL